MTYKLKDAITKLPNWDFSAYSKNSTAFNDARDVRRWTGNDVGITGVWLGDKEFPEIYIHSPRENLGTGVLDALRTFCKQAYPWLEITEVFEEPAEGYCDDVTTHDELSTAILIILNLAEELYTRESYHGVWFAHDEETEKRRSDRSKEIPL